MFKHLNETEILNNIFIFFFFSPRIHFISFNNETKLTHQLKPIEFYSNFHPPLLIPLPRCNCYNCKQPSLQMHAHQMSLAKCRYQSRALSASPSPPPIPPQPNSFEYKQSQPSFTVPPPPPRCYQLIPIENANTSQRLSQQSPRIKTPINTTFERRSLNQNNYENIPMVKPIVVKDPRRKPYYYNELSQNLDIDREEHDSNARANSTQFEPVTQALPDEIKLSAIRRNSDTNYGYGSTLDHAF